eukprot:TRINITY_DN77988_c0_g1_i1.p1 TRINITY_DN77988_c0_g1~~TRINITY_DN77988_c0_g1_i1.p1  ORF type:complete len:182 (+),score=28.52 TRINITY_DN77988_c0_g1_i1:65-547(+)
MRCFKPGVAPSRCDVCCPCLCTGMAFVLAIVGHLNWTQGYFIRPDEARSGCQGHDAHFGQKEAEWRKAWTGSCAFLYRNDPQHEDATQRISWRAGHGSAYEECYKLACKEFCSKHSCLARQIAIGAWVLAGIISLCSLGCCGMVGYKLVVDLEREPGWKV